MASLRFDLFQDEVYVFTPTGEVRDLPEGATPVDFAYMIHTEVGNHCSGAKVNGKLVPLDTQLKNGDTVEIITNSNRKPSRDWLRFVQTAKARTRIKYWIRTEERARSISLAKEMLEKEGRRMGVNVNKAVKKGDMENVAAELSFKSVEDLYSAVGYAKLTPKQVLRRLVPKEEPQQQEEEKSSKTGQERKDRDEQDAKVRREGVSIKGVDDVLVRFAQCCQPVPGDPIVGYISRGRGVTVHTTDCPNVNQFEPERLVNVSWEGPGQDVFPATIKILCKNEKGVLAEITSMLTMEEVNIDAGSFRSDVEDKTEIVLNIEVSDSSHLYRTIEKLSQLKTVKEVTRKTTKSMH
jgi:GTP pyrophosphokinase